MKKHRQINSIYKKNSHICIVNKYYINKINESVRRDMLDIKRHYLYVRTDKKKNKKNLKEFSKHKMHSWNVSIQ